MVCFYHYSCLDLPAALVDYQVEGCSLRLHHVCRGEYVLLNHIGFDGAERDIFRYCVDKLQERDKSETLKKVGYSTMYGTDESENEEEEVDGTVLGGGGD